MTWVPPPGAARGERRVAVQGPRSTDRVGAEAVADLVDGGIQSGVGCPLGGSSSWAPQPRPPRLLTATPRRVMPRRSIRGIAAMSSIRAAARTAPVPSVTWGRVRERLARVKSPKRSRSVTVRPARREPCMRRVTRSTNATSTVELGGDRRARPSADWEPKEPRRRPRRTGRGSRLRATAQVPGGGRAHGHGECFLAAPGELADRGDPAGAKPLGGRRAHPPEALDRERLQESPLIGRSDQQQTVRFRGPARHLRQHLGSSHPDGHGQADLLPRPAAKPSAIWRGDPEIASSPRTSRKASSIESPSTSGAVCSKRANSALLASV